MNPETDGKRIREMERFQDGTKRASKEVTQLKLTRNSRTTTKWRDLSTCAKSPPSLRHITTILATLLLGSRALFASGVSESGKDSPVVLNCGIPECTCRSHKSAVKVNCTGVTQFSAASAAVEGWVWTFPSNTSILIVENSDLKAFPWASFSSLQRVRIIQIHHCAIRDGASLMSLQSANFTRNITNLNLRWNRIQRVESGLLSIFPSVEYLYLASNEITSVESGCFSFVPRLASLDLSNNNLGSAFMQPDALSGLQRLRELRLENCSIRTLHRHAFSDLKRLKYLYLARNQLSVIPVTTLRAAPRLIILHLAFNHITSIDHSFSQLNNIQYLYLHNNGLEAMHPRALDGFDRLQQIVLNNNRLRYLPVGLQPALQQMPRLDAISLVNVTWRCDCRLLWLVRLEQTAAMTSSLDAPSVARCFLPRHLTNTSLRDLSFESLRCPKLAGCEEDELYSVQCEWCPPFQKPGRVGARCMCMEGFEFVPRATPVCQPCPIGLYKEEVSNGACVPCLGNSSTLTVGASVCLCSPGFTQTPTKICEPCAANTFKSKLGNHRCHRCPTSSEGPVGSNSIQNCYCRHSNHYVTGDAAECLGDEISSERGSVDGTPLGGGAGQRNGSLPPSRATGTYVTSQQASFPESAGLFVAISVGVVVVAAVLMVLVLSLVCAKRLPCHKQPDFFVDSTESSRHLLEVTIETNIVSHCTSPETAMHIRRLRVGRLLGRGAFGQVHAGILCVCQNDVKKTFPVAVKRLKDKTSDEEGKVLQEELEQMVLVGPHPNIIQLLGSCVHEGNLYIIMELAEGGDLLTYLRHGKLRHEQYVSVGPDGTLREQQALMVTDHSELMLFVWHIAKGMCHLESVKCIHRDLAARNCLLTAGPVAKLSDFGLSRDVYENGYYFRQSKGRVPYKWLSPEALLWGQYSSKSDVWSFGILLWEVATFGGTPYSGVPADRIADMQRARYRLPQPPACPDKLYRVMRCCWHEDPRKRPTFRTLCDVLELFVQAAADTKYLDLQGQTRPSMADVTPETDHPLHNNNTSPYHHSASPYLNQQQHQAQQHHQQQQQLQDSASLPHCRLSLKRAQRSDGPDLAQLTLTLEEEEEEEEDSGGGMGMMGEEGIELQPMLKRLCSEWSETGSTPSHTDRWEEGKHDNREHNYTSGYSSSRSIVA